MPMRYRVATLLATRKEFMLGTPLHRILLHQATRGERVHQPGRPTGQQGTGTSRQRMHALRYIPKRHQHVPLCGHACKQSYVHPTWRVIVCSRMQKQ